MEEMMKVLLIGSKNRVPTFANQLVEKGYEVYVISNRVMSDGRAGRVNPKIIFHEELVNRLKKDEKNTSSFKFGLAHTLLFL